MDDIKQKLEELAHNIFEITGGYTYSPTWNQNIEAFNRSLEIISYIKNQTSVSDDDYLALRKLTEELITHGIDGPVTHIRSYKRNKLSELTAKVREELVEIPYIEEKKPEIKTVNDWIKSLKIYKLKDGFLSMDYYETSYDIYHDIRKIILTKNPPMYKRIYLGRVVDRLEDEGNKSKLPKNLSIQTEDYELTQLIHLIKDNPDFNYDLMPWKYERALINERFERGEWKNNLLLLIKK